MANTTTTLTVLDAFSNAYTVYTGLPPGSALSVNSAPVVVASDQAQLNVGSHVVSLPALPALSTGANTIGAIQLVDPTSPGHYAQIAAFHNADNQNPGGSAYGLLTGGVAQLLNAAGNLDRQREAPGTLGVEAVSSDGIKPLYGVANVAFTPAATPTDVVTLVGSGTKTIRVKRVAVSGMATTTAGTMDVILYKRTVADTAGTATQPPIASFDSTDAAATAVVNQYSANPTLGAGVAFKVQKLNFGVTGAAGVVMFNFCDKQEKAMILRGTAQSLAINLNGFATVPGPISYEILWEEDNS